MREMYVEESDAGAYSQWEEPQPDTDYVLGMDASEGRGEKSDSTGIWVARREPFALVQVAKWYGRIRQGEAGEIAYKIGCHFNYALINCERNVSGAVEYALRKYRYPLERLFMPPRNNVDAFPGDVYFWWTGHEAKKKMVDIVRLYMGGRVKIVKIRDEATLAEMDGLQKQDSGVPETGGKDLAMSCMMGIIADALTQEATFEPLRRPKTDGEGQFQPGRAAAVRSHKIDLHDREMATAEGVPDFDEYGA